MLPPDSRIPGLPNTLTIEPTPGWWYRCPTMERLDLEEQLNAFDPAARREALVQLVAEHAGVVNEALRSLIAFQTERARGYFRSGLQLIPYLSLRSRASPAVLAALYQRILSRIEAGGFNVFDGRVSLNGREKYLLTVWTWLKSLRPTRVPKTPS